MKLLSFSPPCSKWNWQLTRSNTATGVFFSETKIFNSGIMEIVAPSPRNKKQEYQTIF